MVDEVIMHGRNYIWDMEIDAYKEVYLSSFYEDTIIDFEYLNCDEMYVDMHNLQQAEAGTWKISIPIQCPIDSNALEVACEAISQNCSFIINYFISKEKYRDHEITILINNNMSIYDTFNFAIAKRDIVLDYAHSLTNSKLSKIAKKTIIAKLPVYSRAMKKVELELSNFIIDDITNTSKIIEICSRVKAVDSIQEKVYRKNICQFDVFEKFDDIAGVRCTCEFISDVYEVLEYIKQNPLFNVQTIEDKILTPSGEGYRGIHIIVTTDVYYHGKVYESIKVEIQLRTAFQNAWSMKTHQLTYKNEHGITKDISDTMRMMSDALKEADDAAQKIKESIRK